MQRCMLFLNASIIFFRFAALAAVAISGSRSANHSVSLSSIFSHGGFPNTASNPTGPPSWGRNTSGKASSQWKKYAAAEALSTAIRDSLRTRSGALRKRANISWVSGSGTPRVLGMKKEAHQAFAAWSSC